MFEVNLLEAERFLCALALYSEYSFTFQTFDDRAEINGKKLRYSERDKRLANILHGTFEENAEILSNYNNAGAGIFVTPNITNQLGRSAKHVIAIRALFVDDDRGVVNPKLLSPEPSIVTESSPGRFHYYWLLHRGERLEDFTPAHEVLISALNTDRSIKDLSRVMRLPGFIHRKSKPFMSRMISANENVYHISEVIEGYRHLINTQPKKKLTTQGPLNITDAAHRARNYLSKFPPAIEGEGGDRQTFIAACYLVRNFGLEPPEALPVLQEWNERCVPPWEDGELWEKLVNAEKYGQAEKGSMMAESKVLEIGVKKNSLAYEYHHEAAASVSFDERDLVKGLLKHDSISVMYGQSNVGKSFVAIDLAYHIALGMPWFGKKTDPSAVIYVAAEGGGSIKKRFLAFERYHKITTKCPFALVASSVDLLHDETDTLRLIETIQTILGENNAKSSLVIIDTLHRAMAGGNENDGQEIGLLLKNLDRLKEKTRSSVMLVHHSGKNIDRGARGHSSLRAAIDTEIEITEGKIKIKKQRDLDFMKNLDFELKVMELGKDPDGDAVTSCLSIPRAFGSFMEPAHDTERLLDLLGELEDKDGICAPDSLGLPEGARVVIKDKFIKAGKELLQTSLSRPVTDFIRRRVEAGVLGRDKDGHFLWFKS